MELDQIGPLHMESRVFRLQPSQVPSLEKGSDESTAQGAGLRFYRKHDGDSDCDRPVEPWLDTFLLHTTSSLRAASCKEDLIDEHR